MRIMIKTLRITGIIAAVLAVVFFVFSVVFGVRSDEEIEEFLNSAGVIEEFNSNKGQKSAKSKSQTSPLVKQAERFALYLNPPAKPKPRRSAPSRGKPSVTPRPDKVSAKFNLIGTSFYALHPELSLALIDEPGKGLRWVRQSSEVGRLIIEQVKDGLVVVKDGQRTFEIAVPQRDEGRSLLKKDVPLPEEAGSEPALPALGEAGVKVTGSRAAPPLTSPEEIAVFEEFIRGLQAVQAGGTGKTGSEQSDVETAASMDKFISELQAMRISAEEAESLDRLGKDLNGAEREPNRAGRGKIVRSKSPQQLNEPNKPNEPNNPEKK
jgi:hypothetical protein